MIHISVIVPTFQPQDFSGLVFSMAGNSGDSVEWIVVDDGSGAEYDGIFATLPEGVNVLRQRDNRRQGAARNAGLSKARGQWIKFLDADDKLDSGHLEALLNKAQSVSEKVIPFALTCHVFSDGRYWVNDTWKNISKEPQLQLACQLYRPFLIHCGALFPNALLQELGGYDESLVTDEDGDLLIRVLMKGWLFTPVPEVQYLYIHHGGDRVSSDNDPSKLAARLQVCKKIEDAYISQNLAMPDVVCNGLAKRLDKIALSYWNHDRIAARLILKRAKVLSPSYLPEMRLSLQMLRKFGGVTIMLAVTALYRRFQGRPKGGAQG